MGVGPHDAIELDRVVVLVGVEAPVAVLEAREQVVLDAGVEGLPSHDQPGNPGPVLERDQIGELDHRGPFPVFTVLSDGLVPELLEPARVEDDLVDLGIRATDHREPHVPSPTGGHEALGAPRRVGPDDDLAFDQRGVVTAAVSNRNLCGQLSDGIVEDRHVVAHGVGTGVAGTEHPGERLTGAVAEAQQWMKSEATFVIGSGQFFVLRVDLDERGADVQLDRALALGGRGSSPYLGADLGEPSGDGRPHLRGDLVEGPIHRRVRRHLSEQVGLRPEVLDVGTALAPTGQHQRTVDEDLAPVVQKGPLTRNRYASRQVLTELNAVGSVPQSVESDVGDNLSPPDSTTTGRVLVVSIS
jgi:hypothetical protein